MLGIMKPIMSSWTELARTKLLLAVATARTTPLRVLAKPLRSILTARADAALLQHPAYVPMADVPVLPRILLLGDSISIGYTLPVRRALRGVANVHRPQANCTHTRNGLTQLDSWLGEGKWAIVHVNFGLHDCVRRAGAAAVPIDEYARNLHDIFRRIRAVGAQLAWASTTPVPSELTCCAPDYGEPLVYRETDIAAYNDVAAAIAMQHDAEVDALAANVGSRLSELQVVGDIHFTKAGYAALGREVAGFLRGLLGRLRRRRFVTHTRAYRRVHTRWGDRRAKPDTDA